MLSPSLLESSFYKIWWRIKATEKGRPISIPIYFAILQDTLLNNDATSDKGPKQCALFLKCTRIIERTYKQEKQPSDHPAPTLEDYTEFFS